MDAPSWNRVKAVIGSALERAPSERAAFVLQECGNDPALRAEVESLLAAMEQTGSFVERPALDSLVSSDAGAAARMLDAAGRALEAGDALGPYTILELVGAGVVTVTTQPTFTFSEMVGTQVRIIASVAATSPRAIDIGRDGSMVGAVTAGTLDASGSRAEIRVVLNWFEELKRKAGPPSP